MPCNHVGATPACRQLLLDAEISRVVIAIIDPTSRGEGGAAVLKAAGIDVEVGVLADEALLVLGPWLTATVRQRPWVTWAYPAPSDTGDSVDLTTVSDLREEADIVIGADGRIAEGVPGGHGRQAALPRHVRPRGSPALSGRHQNRPRRRGRTHCPCAPCLRRSTKR